MSIFWGLPDSDRFGGRKCVVILYPPGGEGGSELCLFRILLGFRFRGCFEA